MEPYKDKNTESSREENLAGELSEEELWEKGIGGFKHYYERIVAEREAEGSTDASRNPAEHPEGTSVSGRGRRPSWDEYFMRIASEVATRSTCPRLAVGAVVVRDRRILTTGYNGSPAGMPHCEDVGCLIRIVDGRESCQRTLHAEQNALIQAAYHGVSVRGASVYCTHQPCMLCVKMLLNAGIGEVYYAGGYPDPLAVEIAVEGGLEMVQLRSPAG